MELWRSILLILSEETVYAPILAIIGASLIVLKENEENKVKPSLLLITFFIGMLLSLTLVPVLFDWIETHGKGFKKLRPFGYFACAYFGDSFFDGVQQFIKFLLSKEVRKRVFNAVLNWLLETLTKVKGSNEDDK